jgi:hypothetical protein
MARLARTGSPRMVVRALRREAWLRGERAKLARVLASDEPFVVGPFAGEVGFELLAWRPYVRRLLRAHDVDPQRVTVVTRGGAGLWYSDVAAHSLDVLDVLSPDELREGVERRVARTGQRKQADVDAFDREILDRLGLADRPLLHPLHVFWGPLRFVWEGLEPPAAAEDHGDYDPLERDPSLLDGIELPERFVAVKTYLSDQLPENDANRAAVRALLDRLSAERDVVLLETGLALDDHAEVGAETANVKSLAGRLDPRRNLAQQAEVVARSDALVATYGGFSYFGAFYGVPTVAVASDREWNPTHEHILRAVRPDAPYARATPQEACIP